MPPQTNNPQNSFDTPPAPVSPIPQPVELESAKQPPQWPGRLLLLLIFVVMTLLLWHHQAIADWIKLRDYQPSAQIAQLADQTVMTENARHYFYLNDPQILSKSTFVQHCPTTEQAIVLGCYRGGENGIYVLQITNDAELDGVEQVTAAHEMLHAAYERLSSSERKKINTQLEDYYQHGLTDDQVKAEIAAYQKTEPDDVVNEMHSIFGTELTKLPSGLEQYYKQYFSDRQVVAGYAAKYRAAFDDRVQAVKKADATLAQLRLTINANQTQLQAQSTAINKLFNKMQQLRSEGKIDAYNSQVAIVNRQVDSYNQLLNQTKSLIVKYNNLVEERNAIALQEQQLAKELSGESLPEPLK